VGAGAVERLSAFQAGHIPSCRGSCERYALSPIAAGRRWSLVLLSPLPSAQPKSSGGEPTGPQTPPATEDGKRRGNVSYCSVSASTASMRA
jgi:hypothetical protein